MKARLCVENMEEDDFWCNTILEEVGGSECDHALNSLQAVAHEDGAPRTNCRDLAKGKWRDFAARTLELLDYEDDRWRPLDVFLGNEGGVSDGG